MQNYKITFDIMCWFSIQLTQVRIPLSTYPWLSFLLHPSIPGLYARSVWIVKFYRVVLLLPCLVILSESCLRSWKTVLDQVPSPLNNARYNTCIDITPILTQTAGPAISDNGTDLFSSMFTSGTHALTMPFARKAFWSHFMQLYCFILEF